MNYIRVIPRDLFNESKLLKCLGQLAVNLDKMFDALPSLEHENEKHGFLIRQRKYDGSLVCSNIKLTFEESGKEILVGTKYNSKDPYPMWFEYEDVIDGYVFDDDGNFTEEFKQLICNPPPTD